MSRPSTLDRANTIGSPDRAIDPILSSLVNSQLVQDAGLDSLSRPILALYSCYLPDPK
ncbi:hypothetical protein HDU99_009018, partial [Rhizoclosmatium hyalinum]